MKVECSMCYRKHFGGSTVIIPSIFVLDFVHTTAWCQSVKACEFYNIISNIIQTSVALGWIGLTVQIYTKIRALCSGCGVGVHRGVVVCQRVSSH